MADVSISIAPDGGHGVEYRPLPSSADTTQSSRVTKWHRPVIAFLVVSLVALGGVCAYLDISLEDVTAQLNASTLQLPAENKKSKHTDACVPRAHDPQCITTPKVSY
jgi:hypothetical protein